MRAACSQVFIEAPVQEELVERLVTLSENLTIGDPTERSVYLGDADVIGKKARFTFVTLSVY